MQAHLIKSNNSINIANTEQDEINRIISWNNCIPNFFVPGRVAWYTLKNPAFHKKSNQNFFGVKLKGVGIWNPKSIAFNDNIKEEEYYDFPAKPQLKPYIYTKIVPHFGIDENGEFLIKHGIETPLGGMYIDKCIAEYDNSSYLIHHNVSSAHPLYVFKYEELEYNKSQLGCIVSLIPDSYPFRLDTFLYGQSLNNSYEEEYIVKLLELYGYENSKSENRYIVLKNIFKLYGEELNKFSLSGLYRHSGGINNLYFDFKKRKVVFTDLDSSLRLENIPTSNAALEILRDLASALYKIIYRNLNPKAVQQYHDVLLNRNDQFFDLLIGYFPSNNINDINRISAQLWNFCLPYYQEMISFSKGEGIEKVKWTSVSTFPKDVFFSLCILKTASLYKNSNLNIIYPLVFNQSELIEKVSKFLQKRFDEIAKFAI